MNAIRDTVTALMSDDTLRGTNQGYSYPNIRVSDTLGTNVSRLIYVSDELRRFCELSQHIPVVRLCAIVIAIAFPSHLTLEDE